MEQRTEALSSSEKKFRQLAENIHEVFWMMDPHSGALLYVSPAFDQLWGFSAARVLENPAAWFDSIHPTTAKPSRPSAPGNEVENSWNANIVWFTASGRIGFGTGRFRFTTRPGAWTGLLEW